MGKAKKKRAQKRAEQRARADPMGKQRAIEEEESKQASQFLGGVSRRQKQVAAALLTVLTFAICFCFVATAEER